MHLHFYCWIVCRHLFGEKFEIMIWMVCVKYIPGYSYKFINRNFLNPFCNCEMFFVLILFNFVISLTERILADMVGRWHLYVHFNFSNFCSVWFWHLQLRDRRYFNKVKLRTFCYFHRRSTQLQTMRKTIKRRDSGTKFPLLFPDAVCLSKQILKTALDLSEIKRASLMWSFVLIIAAISLITLFGELTYWSPEKSPQLTQCNYF